MTTLTVTVTLIVTITKTLIIMITITIKLFEIKISSFLKPTPSLVNVCL